MTLFKIATENITVTISSLGAELVSVKNNFDNREYIWCANPKYWKRHSPVLFPLVGRYKNDKSQYEDKEYSMSQHGFARDKEFKLTMKSENEIWFNIEADEDTLSKYPFKFKLECGYRVIGNSVEVMWKVTNKDTKKMYFSLGAHPAFAPPSSDVDMTNCSLQFDQDKDRIVYSLLNENGLLLDDKYTIPLNNKCIKITSDMFDKDALVIENSQTKEVSLLDGNNIPFVTVKFDAPLFGVWSPVKSNVPFVCIEPWYGRSDSTTFDGDLETREWGNELDVEKVFEANYILIFQ
ncbi:aldose 1-epimerase family protein [[Clostridium] fimetarium]|uniref:Galactose mutarotase n=1 Tax=[Clostridium] fimetarium TaxID=99656 RepID=A0A1I0RYG7_9FIRM|nr:aldose 1-epimerase family protein [[Clostridium] fimetarium]SEW46537.1 Galactose mutarotase [[Clostridium] fimetarium]